MKPLQEVCHFEFPSIAAVPDGDLKDLVQLALQ